MPTPPSPRQDAEQVATKILDECSKIHPCGGNTKSDECYSACIACVAAALTAERARALEDAAKVAHNFALDQADVCDLDHPGKLCNGIAAAIRRLIAEGDKDAE